MNTPIYDRLVADFRQEYRTVPGDRGPEEAGWGPPVFAAMPRRGAPETSGPAPRRARRPHTAARQVPAWQPSAGQVRIRPAQPDPARPPQNPQQARPSAHQPRRSQQAASTAAGPDAPEAATRHATGPDAPPTSDAAQNAMQQNAMHTAPLPPVDPRPAAGSHPGDPAGPETAPPQQSGATGTA